MCVRERDPKRYIKRILGTSLPEKQSSLKHATFPYTSSIVLSKHACSLTPDSPMNSDYFEVVCIPFLETETLFSQRRGDFSVSDDPRKVKSS